MSATSLYLSFKSTVTSSQDVDILGSEVGTTVNDKLEALPRLTAVLGDSWKVKEASIPDQKIDVDSQQRTVLVTVPEETRTVRKRSHSGTLRVYTETTPEQVRFETQTQYIRVLRWFNLDGKITETIRYFAHFWDDSGTLKFYMIFAFQDADIEKGFFYHAYWPERTSHSLTRPRVLVFSHETKSTFGRDWKAGVFLVTELEFGPRLKAAASGTDTPLKFGGTLGVAKDQFTFDLFSWPSRTLTFHSGKMVLENARLYARTRDWVDGEEPRTIEGDDEDAYESDDDSPDPHDTQFTLAGNLKLTDELKPLLWTTLPADTGMACWRPGKVPVKLAKVTLLDAVLGQQSWLGAFGGDLEDYLLQELDLTVDLPRREIIHATYTLSGKLTLKNVGPDPVELPDARISCLIDFPGRNSRDESAEVSSEVTVYGTLFEIYADVVQRTATLTSSDGQGYEKWSESFWYKKRLSSGAFESEAISGTYTRLHVWVDMAGKTFRAGVSNDDGDYRAL